MKILISGFEPFDNSSINPSQILIDSIPSDIQKYGFVDTCLLPVDTVTAPNKLIDTIDLLKPDVVVCLGQASGRAVISIEKIAINLLDFRIPDNKGAKIQDQLIFEYAPAAYFSSLPVREIYTSLCAAGIPVEISYSAGTYLCNQVFFCMMHHIAINGLKTQAGFVHLPALPDQVAGKKPQLPSMSIGTMQKAIDKLIEVMSS